MMAKSDGRMTAGPRRSTLITLAVCCMLILSSPVPAGTTFGIYDARTLGMGGVAVASANTDNAQFYNSALLAFNEEIEEQTRDSRFLFPLFVPQLAESTIDIGKLAFDDPSESITRAISDFNAMPDARTAQAVIDVTGNLAATLTSVDGEDVFADIYAGLALSEPGKFQGAGFFLGRRVIAGGRSNVAAADRVLLADYQEGLAFIASGGTQGAAHPELFDANGALIDPGNDLDSTVDAVGVVITEVGVAMSRQFRFFGYPIAAGISFKWLDIYTFEDVERFVDDRPRTDQRSESDAAVNFDVGLAKEFGDHWRVGFAVKDIVPHNHATSLGTDIRFRPRPRIGAAYQAGRLQIAADADLIPNESLGIERSTQEVAVGGEWKFDSPVKLRAGYRHDIEGNRDGMLSIGIGALWKRFAVDLAYAKGRDARSAALQFGIAF